MQEFVHFIDQRLVLYPLMTKEPEKVPEQLMCHMVYDAAYDKAAKFITQEAQIPFSKTGNLCFSLSELYKFRCHKHFPHIRVPVHLRQASYWLLHAFIHGDRSAFMFLHLFVPEVFIEGVSPLDMHDAVERVLIELARLSLPDDGIKAKRKNEVSAYFIADQMIYPKNDIAVSMEEALAKLKAIDEEVEPYQVSYLQQN